jgi:hypothetical protein
VSNLNGLLIETQMTYGQGIRLEILKVSVDGLRAVVKGGATPAMVATSSSQLVDTPMVFPVRKLSVRNRVIPDAPASLMTERRYT